MAIVAFGIAAVGYLAYACAALARIGGFDDPVAFVSGALALAALWLVALKTPHGVTYLVLAILPLFGNHPGGRYMEVVNLPLAAAAAGLIALAQREHRPIPDGPIWRIAALFLLTAILSAISTLPHVIVSAAQLNDPILVVAQALTAAEDNPLYSMSSMALVALSVVWSFALCWAGTGRVVAHRASWLLTLVLFVVMAIGITDFCRLTSAGPTYIRLVDARAFHFAGLQSIFWHPAWFAWYFVIVFPFALGAWAGAKRPMRRFLGFGLAVSYLVFFFNPQRAGLIAVHIELLLFLWLASGRAAHPRRARQRLAAAVVVILVTIAGLLGVPAVRAWVAREHLLSIERSVNNTVEFLGTRTTSERLKLWRTAVTMWRDAPIFGIGEGSFAWRYRDYVPAGSALDTPSHGDAHSTWFQLLATRGIAGTAAFVLLLSAVTRTLWAQRSDLVDGPLAIGLALSMAGFVTYAFVNALFYLQPIQILFWLIVALAAGSTSAAAPPPRRFAIVAGSGAVIAAILLLVGARPAFAMTLARLSRDPRGFYPLEIGPDGRMVRWSSASGVLCLGADTGRVRLRFAAVDPRVTSLTRTVTLRLDGREIDRFDITSEDVMPRIVDLHGPSNRVDRLLPFGECTAGSRRLHVSVNRTWNPTDAGFNADPRRLGILVFEPD